MATADELLREAQYAFQCISFGESSGNARNRRKATSLSRKIIRKYPGTMEASEAYALLRRLGEESYTSNLAATHRHVSEPTKRESQAVVEARTFVTDSDSEHETLNWMGLATWFFSLPRFILAIVLVGGFFLFGIFGPFLFVPLVALLLFTGPLRSTLSREKQQKMDENIRWINAVIEGRR